MANNLPRHTERITLRSDQIDFICAIINVYLIRDLSEGELRFKLIEEIDQIKSKLLANRPK